MWRWRRLAVAGLVALVVPHAPLLGQSTAESGPPPLTRGQRIRAEVTAPHGVQRLEGILQRVGRDSLVVVDCQWREACRRFAVAPSAITSVEMFRGGDGAGRIVAGGFLGLLGGAVLGAVLGSRGCNPDDPCLAPFYHGAEGAVVGLVVGLAIGKGTTPNRWERVPGYPPAP